MPNSPVEMAITHGELRHELQHVKFKRSVRGYDRRAVDLFLEQVVTSYEELSQEISRLEGAATELTAATLERNELRLRVAELEHDSGVSRELAALVRDTLVSAQQAANELRSEAKREVDELRTEARKEAARAVADARSAAHVLRNAETQRDALAEECRQLQGQIARLEAQAQALAPLTPVAPGLDLGLLVDAPAAPSAG